MIMVGDRLALIRASVRYVALVICLLTSISRALGASLEDGRHAYNSEHFSDERGFWARLSTQGSAQAAYALGLLYDLGNGTPEDPVAAFFWYDVAAEASLPAAEFNVGTMYDSGRGVGRDPQLAALWYAKAAVHGYHRAQFNLGILYERGDGVPQNPAAAAAWFQAAGAGGISAAMTRLKTLKAATASVKVNTPLAPERIAHVSLAWPGRDVKSIKVPDKTVEFVWLPPRGSTATRYHLEVRQAGAGDPPFIYSASLNETAALVALPSIESAYIWKVDMVRSDRSVVPGDWSRFSVEPAATSNPTIILPPQQKDSVVQ